jgi:hypothetical protein
MQVSQQTYEDAQYQSSDPIGYQPPIPAGIHDIELSWDRKRGYMRIIIDGKTWHFKEFLGRAQILGTDNKRGRINLRAMARIDGETLTTYRDPSAQPHPEVEGERRESTHNRLCYRRQTQEWRLRDERMEWNHPEALKFTKNYVGDGVFEWHMADSVAHIYHNGFAIIDKDDVAHLYDSEL